MRRFALLSVAAFTALLISAELSLSLPIFGVGPDLLVMIVVAAAVGEHPRSAAVGGFLAGVLRDLTLDTPAGLSAFAYAVTAYAVAMVGPVRGVWVYVGLVAGATFVSQAVYGLGTILVAQQIDVAPLPRVLLVTTLYNALLVPLLMPLLRRLISTEGSVKGVGGP